MNTTVRRVCGFFLALALVGSFGCSSSGPRGAPPTLPPPVRRELPVAVTTPSATPAMTPTPVVSELVVCDATVDCGEEPGRTEWDSVQACLRVTTGGESAQVVLAVTTGERPPNGPESASVVARSAPVQASGTFGCHTVQATGQRLPRGEYWLWVLSGSTALGRARFVLGR